VVAETPVAVLVEVSGGRVRIERARIVSIERERADDYWLARGDELFRLGAYDDAAAHYRRAMAAGSRGAAGRLARTERVAADRALARGDLFEAERRYAEAVRAATLDPADGGAGAAAARDGLAAVTAARVRARERAQAGRRALAEKRSDAALLALAEAAALDRSIAPEIAPYRAQAAAGEGARHAAAGDLARAVGLFEEAFAADPAIAPFIARPLAAARIALGVRLLERDDASGAAAILREAVAADPTARAPRFYLGLALELADDPLGAADAYRSAIGGSAAPLPADALRGDLALLRSAAARAAGPLPYAPEPLLDRARWDRVERALPVAAERGSFVVHAGSPALGEAALGALEDAQRRIAAWAGDSAREFAVAVYIYDTEAQFRAATGEPAPALGITRTTTRRGEVTGRRIYTFGGAPRLLECVLPHEATHALTAPGRADELLPLWMAEGIAVASEPEDVRRAAIARVRRAVSAGGGSLPLREALRLRGYPTPGDVPAFYDEASALVEFLIERGGRERLLAAGRRAGGGDNLEPALREAYGFETIDELLRTFEAWLGGG
jgi:hypothetical protein